MGVLSLKKLTGSEGLDLGGENAGLASLALGAFLGPAGYGLTAAQAGLATGGAMALATGSLQKGIMAGLGAYGGAGLAEGIMNLGASGAAQALNPQLTTGEIAREIGQEGFVKPGIMDTLGSAGKSLVDSPMESLKTIGGGSLGQTAKYGLAATLPIMAGMGVPTTTGMPSGTQYPGFIRPFSYDPRTQRLTPFAPVPTARLYAEGGVVEPRPESQPPQGMTFIPDAPLPEGMVGTTGGTGFDPLTGRLDLGTAGGSGYYVAQGQPQPEPQQPAFRDPVAQAAIQQRMINEQQQRAAQQQLAQQAQQQAITAPFQQSTNPTQNALAQALAYTPTTTQFTPTPMTGDSAAAYNYLMGQSEYPYITQDKEVFRPYTELVADRIFNAPMIPTPTQAPAQGGGQTQTGGNAAGAVVAGAGLAAAADAAGLIGGGSNMAPVVDMSTVSPGLAAANAADQAAGQAVGDIGSTMPTPLPPLSDIEAGQAVGDIGSTMPTPFEPGAAESFPVTDGVVETTPLPPLSDVEAGQAVGDIGSTMPTDTALPPVTDAGGLPMTEQDPFGFTDPTLPVTPYEPLTNAAIEDIAARAIASQGLAYPGGAAELAVHANNLGAAEVAAAELAGGAEFATMAAQYGPYIAAAIIIDQMLGGAIVDAIGDVVTGVGDVAGDVASGVLEGASDIVSGVGDAVGNVVSGVGNAAEDLWESVFSGCFLTTAASEHAGEEDDGAALTAMRSLRDDYLKKSPEGRREIEWYYRKAPKIVDAIDKKKNAHEIYMTMYNKYILPTAEAVEAGDYEEAHQRYAKLIGFAKKASGLSEKELSMSKGPVPQNIKKNFADGGLSMTPTIQTSNQLGTMLDDDLINAYERAAQKGDAAKARAYKSEIDYRSRNPSRMATGGISDAHYNLGGYSDGGRLLRGPGDGVSDDIPATIGRNKQPARLADGEFVVPARIVSELGNGSTEAGARKLYAMMDRIQAARRKTVGKGKVAKNTRADKYLPA